MRGPRTSDRQSARCDRPIRRRKVGGVPFGSAHCISRRYAGCGALSVPGAINSSRSISGFVFPRAMRRTISSSRGLRWQEADTASQCSAIFSALRLSAARSSASTRRMPQRLARVFSESSMSVLASTSMTTPMVSTTSCTPGSIPVLPSRSAMSPPHRVNSELTRVTPVSATMATPVRFERS